MNLENLEKAQEAKKRITQLEKNLALLKSPIELRSFIKFEGITRVNGSQKRSEFYEHGFMEDALKFALIGAYESELQEIMEKVKNY